MTAASLAVRRPATLLAAPRRQVCGLAAALLLQLAVAAPMAAAQGDAVIARVNGTEIRASDLAIAEEDVGANLPMTGDARREYLTKYLSDMILVAQAAESKKLQDRDDFKRRLAYSRDKLLMEMLPAMVENGRRIIVFSQFVEMLDLIEAALRVENLGYVRLTGQTRFLPRP